MMLRRTFVLVVLVGLIGIAKAAEESKPIAATDTAALKAAIGKEVVVEGTIAKAAWSATGKVMNIEFEGAKDGFLCAVFDKNKNAFDDALGGDAAKTLTGAKVKIKGKVSEYGGKSEKMKGRPEMVLNLPKQVTVVEGAKN